MSVDVCCALLRLWCGPGRKIPSTCRLESGPRVSSRTLHLPQSAATILGAVFSSLAPVQSAQEKDPMALPCASDHLASPQRFICNPEAARNSLCLDSE